MYSGDLKLDPLNSRNIWNQDFLRFQFLIVRFPKGQALEIASLPFENPNIENLDFLVWISNSFFLQNGGF